MIYWRDNFQCRHCKNRNGLHPHHVTFRSQGGNDDMNNVITLCACCHLDGVHKGNLKIEVVERTEDNVIVKFTRKGKWKPT
jgi:5-methylcytosine-specific restriction endonuclease McrA